MGKIWKYAAITGFLGKLKDRFIDYQPAREMEEMMEMAARIERCEGLELVYPQNFTDPVKAKELLKKYNLKPACINLNVKGEEKWRWGTFSSPNAATRKEAVKYFKECLDIAHFVGCDLVTSAFLNDGADYPFELDYIRAWQDTLEAIREVADHRKDIRVSLEYKASEPRVHCLLNNAGKMAYFCESTGKSNVGVTLDTGHAFQCQEIPADSVAFLGATKRLFYLHINDNYRNWDWDLVPGTVNPWDFVEMVLYLKRVDYKGWITADVFPGRHDPVEILSKTFIWMDKLIELSEKLDAKKLFDAMNNRPEKTLETLDYVRDAIYGK